MAEVGHSAMLHRLVSLMTALCIVALQPREARAEIPSIAVVDFAYRDTSGEPRDQSAEHAQRLSLFMRDLTADLSREGRFSVVTLACERCDLTAEKLPLATRQAREAGADFLLVGGIQKMSTLVQWAEVSLIDVRSGQSVLRKLYTFRGDTDEAWRRAEKFIADQITIPAEAE